MTLLVEIFFASCQHGVFIIKSKSFILGKTGVTMKPGQSMFGFSSVKRITLREGLY